MSAQAAAESLKPFILGDTPPGDLKQVTEAVKSKLTMQGFEIVGSYSPLGESGAGPVPRARYRIALNFPDTTMAGAHGFTKIMTAPWGI